jgi:hypothetical protein
MTSHVFIVCRHGRYSENPAGSRGRVGGRDLDGPPRRNWFEDEDDFGSKLAKKDWQATELTEIKKNLYLPSESASVSPFDKTGALFVRLRLGATVDRISKKSDGK